MLYIDGASFFCCDRLAIENRINAYAWRRLDFMKRQVVLPNLLTAISLCCGLFVIFKMNMIHPGTTVFTQVLSCVEIILLAAVVDVLDGAVARAMNVESAFGGFFDSMADAVSFGVAPSVIVLKSLSVVPGTVLSGFIVAAAITYSTAGVLRLVRYSTTPPPQDPELYGTFTGLPITAAAMAVVSLTLCLMNEEWQTLFPITDFGKSMIAGCMFFLLAYLMVSRWRFPSLKSINVRVRSLRLVVAIASLSSIVLVVALNNFPAALLLVSWGYVLIAWSFAIIRLAQGKRKAALDDTEEKEE